VPRKKFLRTSFFDCYFVELFCGLDADQRLQIELDTCVNKTHVGTSS